MTTDEMTLFRARLVSAVTTADRRESAVERRRGRENIWRLGHYMGAVTKIMEKIEKGATPEAAFAEHFVPTAHLHTAAKKLNLALTVERGRWVPVAPK